MAGYDAQNDAALAARLEAAGLRVTKQRLGLARLLFSGPHRHVTADGLAREAEKAGLSLAPATIYNTLGQFRRAGLLREVPVAGQRSHYDTDPEAHHHFYLEETGELIDIPDDSVALARLPSPPEGHSLSRVEIILRIARNG